METRALSEEQNNSGKPQDEENSLNPEETLVDSAENESVEVADTDLEQESEAAAEPTDAEKIDALANQLVKAQEDVLRAQAEAQNSRRRADGEVDKARKFALERFVGDLLPVIDNLDRALSSIDQSDESFKGVVEGIELTRNSFIDTLTKYQVEQVDPAGEPFDPELHQAMTMVPNPDLEPNTVMDVFQKGYRLNGRLIRPAMVVVSKLAE